MIELLEIFYLCFFFFFLRRGDVYLDLDDVLNLGFFSPKRTVERK